MNTSFEWIKSYVPDLDVTIDQYVDGMTLSGSKVESVERLDADLKNIIVGKICSIQPHPDADKLVVCQVQITKEGEQIQIVTGANNIKEGDFVPVVLDGGRVATDHSGARVQGGTKIKKGKLRGISSNGMMCSIEELGSSREYYPEAPERGIYVFQEPVEIGADAVACLGLRDARIEYEITSNRVDCFSMLGIAREAAATFCKTFVPPKEEKVIPSKETTQDFQVQVLEQEACTRYILCQIENVKIGPSPRWMQRRLAANGIRPINNIVDITNYVMEEYGYPMHAYDRTQLEGGQIIVRFANPAEQMQTLDGQERKLDPSTLVICDAKKPVGIAGIMGAESSKVRPQTTSLLLEVACFDGTMIRKTSKRLGLRTDASAKFEKGLDPNGCLQAMERACEWILKLQAGEIVGSMIDIQGKMTTPKRIAFSPERINQLLGTQITKEQMLSYFAPLGLVYDATTEEIIVPTQRQDLEWEADLAEEVARFYGYDRIPTTLPHTGESFGKRSTALQIRRKIRDVVEQYGFSEAMCYSFESPHVYEKLNLKQEEQPYQPICISNPLGEDYSIMRTLPLNAMLTALQLNYNRRNQEVKLYEIGNIYLTDELPLQKLPQERMQLTLGMYEAGDFFDLKGTVEDILASFHLPQKAVYRGEMKKPFFHPGRQATIFYDNMEIGYIGELHPDVLERYQIGTRAYIAVLDLQSCMQQAPEPVKYQPIPKYPAMTRDICVILQKQTPVAVLEQMIQTCGGALLESFSLFDLYEGDQIEAGYRSVAYRICFRAKDRTLEENEVNQIMDRILKKLPEEGMRLREK